jgi:hypothetical protein
VIWKKCWSDECQKAFDKLKEVMQVAPILQYPDIHKEFHLYCDASDYGVGNVLEQDDADEVRRVVSFGGQKFSAAQTHYSQPEKECLAIVRAFKEYRTYLLGSKVTVYTDHQSLTYILNTRRSMDGITTRMFRWVIKLQEYDFVVKFIPGLKLTNADSLSRSPFLQITQEDKDAIFSDRAFNRDDGTANALFESFDHESTEVLDVSSLGFVGPEGTENGGAIVNTTQDGLDESPPWDLDELRVAQKDDEHIRRMTAYKLQQGFLDGTDQDMRAWITREHGNYFIFRDLLYHIQTRRRRGKRSTMYTQLVVPQPFRQGLMQQYHEEFAAHMSYERTLTLITRRYFWQTISKDVRTLVDKCVVCAKFNLGGNRKVPLKPIEVPATPWHTLAVDILGPLTESISGYSYIISYVDYFTKWPEVMPIVGPTISEVQRTFREVVGRFGYPRKIITDRGSCFTAQTIQDMFSKMDIEVAFVVAGHHQSNGLVERWNRTLMDILRKASDEYTSNWDEKLPLLCLAYRACIHAATGETPFRLNFGRDVALPKEGKILCDTDEVGMAGYVRDMTTRMQEIWEEGYQELILHQTAYKQQFDRRANKTIPTIAPGDIVFVLAKSAQTYKGLRPKFKPMFETAYRVVEIEGYNLTLRVLNRPPGKDIIIHRDMVKIFPGTEKDFTAYLERRCALNLPSDSACRVCFQEDAPADKRTRFVRKGEQMWLACDGEHDPVRWFHWECVGLKREPKKGISWFCSDCQAGKIA